MLTKFTIRDGRLKDAEAVLAIWHELIEHHQQIAAMDFEMRPEAPDLWLKFYCTNVRSRTRKVLVAEEDGKIIGYTLGSIQERPPVFKIAQEALITDMCVTTNKRRKGVGTKLIEAFASWAKQQGMKYLVMQMVPENKIGKKFWDSLEFHTIMLKRQRTL